jgi:hypothetical protein
MFSSIANHLDKAYFTSSATQAIVDHYRTKNPRFFKLIHKVTVVFWALNIGSVLWGIQQIIDCVDKKKIAYSFLISTAEIDIRLPLLLIGIIFLIYAKTVQIAVSRMNKYFNPKQQQEKWKEQLQIPENVLSTIKVEKDLSPKQIFTQDIYVSQLIVSIAAIFFSSRPLFFAANAACHLYSLIKVSSWRSIRFERKFLVPRQPNQIWNPLNISRDWRQNLPSGPQSYTCSYFCSIFPFTKTDKAEVTKTDKAEVTKTDKAEVTKTDKAEVTKTDKTEDETNCAICLEKEPTSHFCAKHAFDDDCLIGMIYTKSQKFLSGAQPTRIRHETRSYGTKTGEYITYSMKIPQENLPCCPLCREQPPQNEVQIVVEDVFNGRTNHHSASITIVPTPLPQPRQA